MPRNTSLMTPDELREYKAYRSMKARQRRLNNLEYYRARQRDSTNRWRAAHPEGPREYHRKYRADPERRAIEIRYDQTHKQQTAERGKRWRINNPERNRLNIRLQAHKRRARFYSAPGSYDMEQLFSRFQFHLWKCRYCGCTLTETTVTADHQIPLCRGVSNWPSNIVPSCLSCNCRKRHRTPGEFHAINGSPK